MMIQVTDPTQTPTLIPAVPAVTTVPTTTATTTPKLTVTDFLDRLNKFTSNAYNNAQVTTNQIGNGINKLPLHDKLNNTMGLVSNFMNAYNSYQANKLAKQQLDFNKHAWNKNWEAQKGLTNSRLADRQQRRFNESGGTGMTVNEYMNKYGVR